MKSYLARWKKDWKLMSLFFTGTEISLITERLKNLQIRNVVFCSFENRFAKSGGLASVMTNILPFVKEVNAIPVVLLMTPFYPSLMSEAKVKTTQKHFSLLYANRKINVEILESSQRYSTPGRGSIREYYLKSDHFFNTSETIKDPYCYHESDTNKNNELLRSSALFFCKAVPHALNALGIREDIVCHLHEWQTALISLTAKEAMTGGVLQSCGTVQTIHNSYDAQFSWESLARILDKRRRKSLTNLPGDGLSSYQAGLQLVDAPVTTVSAHFARELTSDIIQTKHFVPHLQNILKSSVPVGINNGMFVDYSPLFPAREKHTLSEVRAIKSKSRQDLRKMLSVYRPKERFGTLTYKGETILKLPVHVPIIVMTGRLDPLQKGYFVLLRTVEKFAEDEIKVILAPLPARKSDLDYFYEVACKCNGNVTVFPFRMRRGYREMQAGSTFGIMPSVYEPFGAAVEYMANGTVNIGRATGGLVDQIDSECGFLYREDAVFHTLKNVKAFVDSSDLMQARKTNPWMLSMADNLYAVIKKAVDIYRNHPDDYYRMIINGFKKVRTFSWESSAKKYYRIYEMIRNA
jgi:glycogen synthase